MVLSHRNLVAGVESVVSYLANIADDRILAALPLSFDYGLNQVTTALYAGGMMFLCDYLRPKELLRVMVKARIIRTPASAGLAGDLCRSVFMHSRVPLKASRKMPIGT